MHVNSLRKPSKFVGNGDRVQNHSYRVNREFISDEPELVSQLVEKMHHMVQFSYPMLCSNSLPQSLRYGIYKYIVYTM